MSQGEADGVDDKAEFLEQVKRTASQAERLKELSRKMQESAHFAGEIAAITHLGFSALPADHLTREQWSQHVSVWRGLEMRFAQAIPDASAPDSLWAGAYAVASTSSDVILGYVEAAPPQTVHIVQGQIRKVLARTPLLDAARSSVQRLRLDRPSGGVTRTTSAHLDAADRSLAADGNQALFSLREAIKSSVRQLWARLPVQQEASSHQARVVVLGRLCGRVGVVESEFEILGATGHQLIDKLSASKDRAPTGEQVRELFNEGLLHLNAVLGNFDEARLKPPP